MADNPVQQRVDRLVQISGGIVAGVAAHRVPTEKDMNFIVEASAALLLKLEDKARDMGVSTDDGYSPPKPRAHPESPS